MRFQKYSLQSSLRYDLTIAKFTIGEQINKQAFLLSNSMFKIYESRILRIIIFTVRENRICKR